MIEAVMNQWINSNSQKFWRIWLMILALGASLAALSVFFVDQKWAQHFGSEKMVQVWLFHRNITEIGEAGVYIVLALFALLIKKYRKYAAYLLASMFTSGLVLHIIKMTIGRARPHKIPDNNPFVFEPFNFHHHFQSFPSGHSQTLFTLAVFVSFFFPKTTPWVLLVALYLAFTRAITLAHFVSDVWAGATLGLLMTAVTLRYLVRKYGT